MNLPTREECEGWDHMKVALFMCKVGLRGITKRFTADGGDLFPSTFEELNSD